MYDGLPDANRSAREYIVTSKSTLRLPEDAFVFYWDYGGSFYFFRPGPDDDPAVYFFLNPEIEARLHQGFRMPNTPPDDPFVLYALGEHEGDDFFCQCSHFSEYLESEIKRHVQIKLELEARRNERSVSAD